MVIEHKVKGLDEFNALIATLENNGEIIHIFFSGGKEANGESWCPYCVSGEPVVRECLKDAPPTSHFIYCDVGERPYWKDPNCPFRKDTRLNLNFLPTLLRWKTQKRLDSLRVSEKELVAMLIGDDD